MEIKTIPIDEEMARTIVNSLVIASHRKPRLNEFSEITQRILRVLYAVYPEVINEHGYSQLQMIFSESINK